MHSPTKLQWWVNWKFKFAPPKKKKKKRMTPSKIQSVDKGCKLCLGRTEVFLFFCHLVDHVIKDATMVEIGEFHIRVKTHHSLEFLPCIQLKRRKTKKKGYRKAIINTYAILWLYLKYIIQWLYNVCSRLKPAALKNPFHWKCSLIKFQCKDI